MESQEDRWKMMKHALVSPKKCFVAYLVSLCCWSRAKLPCFFPGGHQPTPWICDTKECFDIFHAVEGWNGPVCVHGFARLFRVIVWFTGRLFMFSCGMAGGIAICRFSRFCRFCRFMLLFCRFTRFGIITPFSTMMCSSGVLGGLAKKCSSCSLIPFKVCLKCFLWALPRPTSFSKQIGR